MNRRQALKFLTGGAAAMLLPAGLFAKPSVHERLARGEAVRNELIETNETIVLRDGYVLEGCHIKSTANPVFSIPSGLKGCRLSCCYVEAVGQQTAVFQFL